ncbi:hypothetical protein H4R19_001422 [Coemansia spiralis]|nr:hypothetical protein H4R19_001422 [Coemansia spiralis]
MPGERSYPLRKRSEKNLHPYTRLVWTNPDELRMLQNARRKVLALEDGHPAGPARQYAEQDDSEDEDYVPGSPELAAADSQFAALDLAPAPLRSPHARRGLTYHRLAARRRHQATARAHEKHHGGGGGGGDDLPDLQLELRPQDSDHLPSVSSLLGMGSGDPADPFAFPESGELRIPTAADSPSLHLHADGQGLELPSSPLVEPQALLAATAPEAQDLSTARPSHSPGTALHKRRRLLSRRTLARAHDREVEDGASSESSAELLPTTRARRLGALSRRQIRGVLPFSFMHELDRGRREEIDEEVGRWQQRRRGGPTRMPALPSSSPDMAAGAAEHWAAGESDCNAPMGDGNDVAMLFEDPGSPHVQPPPSNPPGAGPQPRFRFNFMDVYEWQYPPLAPVEFTGRAPDFLRIAARECRRRGIRCKAGPDDPELKAISIEMRPKDDEVDEDVAQGIIQAWRMGVIDIRRVYFSDDAEESDDFYASWPDGAADWLRGTSTAVDPALGASDAIMVSDDEAVEDNATYDHTGGSGGGRRTARARNRRGSGRPRQRQLEPSAGTRFLSGKRNSRPSAATAASRRLAAHTPLPAARGLDAVMHEFTKLDSDSEDGGGSREDAGFRCRLPPSVLGQHMARRESSRARQEQFVARFSRPHQQQHSGGNQRRRTAGRGRAVSATGQGYIRVGGARRVAGALAAAPQAEFVFDDDIDMDGSDHHRAGIQVSQTRAKSRQTRLLSNRPATASAVHMRGPRLPAPAHSAYPSLADAVADRLHKNRPGPRRASPAVAGAKQRARGIQRKAAPTRAYFDSTARRNVQPIVTLARDRDSSGADGPHADTLFSAGTGLDELRCLSSGARFPNSMWIAQGGLRRVHRRLHDWQAAASSESGGADADGSYQYGGILQIDMAASPAEYGQAQGMLFMLWHERMAGTGGAADLAAEEDSVLRWTEFSQRLIVASSRSSSVLAQLARRLVDGARGALQPLAALANGHGQGPLLAAAVGLSYAVVLLQLAHTLAWARGAAAHRGPRAVGEEEDALAALWTGAQLTAEIDKFLAVLVRLLGSAARGTRHFQLGHAEQIWVALLHTFTDDAGPSGDAAPAGSIWKAVLAACTPDEANSRWQAGSLWLAFGLLLPLAQVNIDGVAAPRPAAHLHRPLLALVEAAVEKGLLPGTRDAGDADAPLRPSEEAAVRQTFARVHSIAVAHGVAIGAGSPLYMTLYRNLEGRQFRSLGIEPPPSLPRFFTRYSGAIRRESSVADSCTVLWLKSLDASLVGWIAQLRAQPQASRDHRRHLQTVRAAVSKMLPTRILTFAPSTPAAQLSTLANYYAVFLFFLHAVPGDVVRASRLATQFQALLRFRDSASQVARRVYFEAWSAAATIVGLRLRRALEAAGNMGAVVAELVGGTATPGPGGRLADVCDCHAALRTAVGGWADSLGAVLDGLRAADDKAGTDSTRLWALVDAAFMYLNRVLTSDVLASHAPTVVLVVLEVLRSPSVLALLTWDSGNSHASMLHWAIGIVQIWQDATATPQVAAPSAELVVGGGGGTEKAVSRPDVEEPVDGPDTQILLEMVDSGDLLEAAAEADEMERRATFMAADAAAVRAVHEQYVPRMRLHIMAMFTSLSVGAPLAEHRGAAAAAALEATVVLLAQMVAVCVDSGLRTWESFLDEHGRDSLYLIPNWHGRRLVLVVFAVAAIDVIRAKGQSTARIEALAKDVWFASVCDLSLAPYVHRLAAQLRWLECQAGADDNSAAQAVFATVPVDRGLLVEASGMLRTPLGRSMRRADDAGDGDGNGGLVGEYEHRAALAVSCIASVLQGIAQALRDPAAGAAHAGRRQQLSSWVAQLLSTQRQAQQSAARATHALADTRDLIDAMAERVTLLVRDSCAELFLPPHLMVQPR